MNIVPARKEHIEAMGMKIPMSVWAIAVIDDSGSVMGVGGTYLLSGNRIAFMKITDELRKRPKTLFSMALKFIRQFDAVYAFCDLQIDGADRFLRHLGFKHMHGDLWQIQ